MSRNGFEVWTIDLWKVSRQVRRSDCSRERPADEPPCPLPLVDDSIVGYGSVQTAAWSVPGRPAFGWVASKRTRELRSLFFFARLLPSSSSKLTISRSHRRGTNCSRISSSRLSSRRARKGEREGDVRRTEGEGLKVDDAKKASFERWDLLTT